jgi:tetratricopeptide (TPR) repeat protein
VPLFVEELTKAVLEAGAQAPAALSAMPQPALSVPATLHASLMARLDRLGPIAKEVAQAGATIGREFRYSLLATITDLPEPQLREALDRLTHAGLVFARGAPPEASYLFKHALVQDAAYGSLLRSRRQSLHRHIAVTLEARFPEIVQAQPALLAQHCQKADLAEQAVSYWLKAGQQALVRSAMTEAAAQLRRGLDLLAGLPDGLGHQQQELELQTALGTALAATKGWSALEVNEAINRARTLAEALDRQEHLVPLLFSQWAFLSVRAEYRLSLTVAEQVEQIGQARNDTVTHLLGHLLLGATWFSLGELVSARVALERCMDLADPAYRTVSREGLSIDPYAAMLPYLAMTLACLGYVDQARSRMNEAVSEGRRLSLRHVLTLAHVFQAANWLDALTHSPTMHTEKLMALATEHGFPHYLGWALTYRGWELVARGQAQEGLALLTQALVRFRSIGSAIPILRLLMYLAQTYAKLGQSAEERNCLDEAWRLIEVHDERLNEADLHRISGNLLVTSGDRSGAEQHYRQAIAVAERQSAKLFQLRASISLARLWRDQGRLVDARDLLVPIYGWFTEGFDAPVLKEAKALLDELA